MEFNQSKPKFALTELEKRLFYSRKGFYSWNVLGVVDDQKVFIMFTTRWPGASHDCRMHNESWMRVRDERQFDFDHPRFHVGDQGFQCQKTCVIPVRQRDNRVLTRAEKLYNKTLTSFRAINEHAFGNWKGMFPILCSETIGIIRKENSTYSQVSDGSVKQIRFFGSRKLNLEMC